MNSTNEFSFFLAPSKIAGVGVFATHSIKKGTHLDFFIDPNDRFIPIKKLHRASKLEKKFYDIYCVEDEKGLYCPRDFRQMQIGCYINHSEKPNAFHKNYEYYALRNIKKGEEITIDYKTLDESELVLIPNLV